MNVANCLFSIAMSSMNSKNSKDSKNSQSSKNSKNSKALKRLGKGTFGYVVQDEDGHAKKHFFQDCQEAALRETTIGSLLKHKSIMHIMQAQYAPEQKSITMRCAVGSVEDLIESKYAYGESFIQTVLSNLLKAVAYIHSIGIMHRDIKPANILIFDENDTVLTDFSLSKFECEAECHSPRCGTQHYMASELSDCSYNLLVDDYAVGVTIMELVLAACNVEKKQHDAICALIKLHNPKWSKLIKDLCEKCPSKRARCTDLVKCNAGFCVQKIELASPSSEIQAPIEEVLESLDVHDKYYQGIGAMVLHWQTILLKAKKPHLFEFIICAVCLVSGFTTDELFCCFSVFESHIIQVINDMASSGPVSMYGCCVVQEKTHVPALCKEPFICDIHDDTDTEEESESYGSAEGSQCSVSSDASSEWERPLVNWKQIITSQADKKLTKLRSTARDILKKEGTDDVK